MTRAPQRDDARQGPLVGRHQLDALDGACSRSSARPAGCARLVGGRRPRHSFPNWRLGEDCADTWFFRGQTSELGRCAAVFGLCACIGRVRQLDPNLLSTLDGDVEAARARLAVAVGARSRSRRGSSTSSIEPSSGARCSNSLPLVAERDDSLGGPPRAVELLGDCLRRPPEAAVRIGRLARAKRQAMRAARRAHRAAASRVGSAR